MRAAAGNPCRAPLDDAAWRSLGFATPGAGRTLLSGENSCRWSATDGEHFVSLIVVPGRDVLVDTYRVRQFAVFAPITVAGLPGTEEQAAAGASSCSLTVGTAIGQGFIVNFDGPRRETTAEDPCEQGRRIAERVVAALPPLPAT